MSEPKYQSAESIDTERGNSNKLDPIPICTTHNRPAAHAQNTDTCDIVNLVVVEPDYKAAAMKMSQLLGLLPQLHTEWLEATEQTQRIVQAAIPGRIWAEEE